MVDDVGAPLNSARVGGNNGRIPPMSRARGLGLALLILAACDAPDQPESIVADAAPMMERTVVEPDTPRSAEPRVEPSRREAKPPRPDLAEPAVAYDRKAWPHWIDEDRDCQDARTEVLIAESYERVGFEDERRCEVTSGAWQCPYTGKIIREAHLLDVDHLVPLGNAHRSGAASWTPDERRRYSNDLEHPEHLVAVDYAANRSKSDKGPEAWLPPSEDSRCAYVRDWIAVKERWGLSMSEAEAAAIADASETCKAGGIPPLPQAKPKAKQAKPKVREPAPAPVEQTCCRTCKKGKACGDGCIAETSTCTKPPGCACDG